MKIFLSLISIFLSFISLSLNDTSLSLPPLEILENLECNQYVFELPTTSHFKIFNQRGKKIHSGTSKFIDFSGYETGVYFIHYNNKIENFQLYQNSTDHTFGIIPGYILLLAVILFLVLIRLRNIKREQHLLLQITNDLKSKIVEKPYSNLGDISLNKTSIEKKVNAMLNQSDWKVIDQIVANPSISNKELAEKISLSVEGTRSSLKKLYRNFEIPYSRNMKLALVIKLMQFSTPD